MQAKVTWNEKMSFLGSAETGFTLNLDASSAVGGEDNGFRPLELMALSLAGCTAMDVISILNKKRQQITAFEVRVDADRAEQHPKVITNAVVTYEVVGHEVDEAAVVRAMQLSAERYCPAQAMLVKVFPMQLAYEIYADQGDGKKELRVKGTWEPEE